MLNYKQYILPLLLFILLTALSYLLQTYQFTALEESHIMLYDADYVWSELAHPGGFAQLMASFCTQFFIYRWAGPLIASLAYLIIIVAMSSIAFRRGCPIWVAALSVLPCMCLMLCLENSAYKFMGTMALMLNAVSLLLYCRNHKSVAIRVIAGCILSVLMYYLTGAAALVFSVSAFAYDLMARNKRAWISIAYPVLTLATGYAFYYGGALPTVRYIYAPVAYYDMGSTFFMMVYAMCSVVVCIAFAALVHSSQTRALRQSVYASAVVIVSCMVFGHVYSSVHSRSNYRLQQERYLARHAQWDQILALPYDGAPTPFTSYRFLALAHQGKLAERIGDYRPFISYLLENKPMPKKQDQQVLSDIYYDCCYLAAARHSAFDTDIVTPGAFNPYETQKLAMINIAFGDYGVADKLLSYLEKTLFYSDWAADKRRFLYDDAAVEADPQLSRMRRAIPQNNNYMSPKGIERDLRFISTNDSSQAVAEQFHRAFLILINQH